MPIPVEPILGAGLDLVGQGISMFSQHSNNKAQAALSKAQYDYQRKDALADYHMQNEYNSPAAQMKRLKEAGLNPNLVYGSGNAITPAPTVKGSSPGSTSLKAPQVDLANVVMGYAQIAKILADTAYVNAQRGKVPYDIRKTEADTANVKVNTAMTDFDLTLKENLENNTRLQASATLRDKLANAQIAEAELARRKLMMEPDLSKVLQEILLMKKEIALKQSHIELNSAMGQRIAKEVEKMIEEIKILQTDGSLKNLELYWKEHRGRAGDYPGWLKPLTDFIQDFTTGVPPGPVKK